MANIAPMEQLLAFVDWERQTHPDKQHVAEWALQEIERLRTLECVTTRDLLDEVNAHIADDENIRKRNPDVFMGHNGMNRLPSKSDGLLFRDVANTVCQHLPQGYELRLCLEEGAATVELYHPSGARLPLPDPADQSLEDIINKAIDLANDEAAPVPDAAGPSSFG